MNLKIWTHLKDTMAKGTDQNQGKNISQKGNFE